MLAPLPEGQTGQRGPFGGSPGDDGAAEGVAVAGWMVCRWQAGSSGARHGAPDRDARERAGRLHRRCTSADRRARRGGQGRRGSAMPGFSASASWRWVVSVGPSSAPRRGVCVAAGCAAVVRAGAALPAPCSRVAAKLRKASVGAACTKPVQKSRAVAGFCIAACAGLHQNRHSFAQALTAKPYSGGRREAGG